MGPVGSSTAGQRHCARQAKSHSEKASCPARAPPHADISGLIRPNGRWWMATFLLSCRPVRGKSACASLDLRFEWLLQMSREYHQKLQREKEEAEAGECVRHAEPKEESDKTAALKRVQEVKLGS